MRYDKDAWKVIGGNVLQNHLKNPDGFQNSCTIRMSRTLNKSGISIPYIKDKTISGADNSWNFYRVKDLKQFLESRYGFADITGKDRKLFIGKKGIICFDISYLDATGHATLFDGKETLGGEHDTNYYFTSASKIFLWTV